MAAAFTTFTTSASTRERSKRSHGMSSSVQCFMPCHPCCRPPARATFLMLVLWCCVADCARAMTAQESIGIPAAYDQSSRARGDVKSIHRVVARFADFFLGHRTVELGQRLRLLSQHGAAFARHFGEAAGHEDSLHDLTALEHGDHAGP